VCGVTISPWRRRHGSILASAEEGTIGRSQRRAPFLSSEHDELMPQHEQLDISGELVAPAT
jgi:hypothetical protein